METLDVIQTLTELVNLSVSVRSMGSLLADRETKLQLARSMIGTVIHELELKEDSAPEQAWLKEYLMEGLEHLK
jgi:hypothetical protein